MNEKQMDERNAIARFAYIDEGFSQRASAYGSLFDRVEIATERDSTGDDSLPTINRR